MLNKNLKLFKEAYKNIKLKRFDKAINSYNKLIKLYNSSKEKDNEVKLKNDLEILYQELDLYLKVNEAYIQAKQGNFTNFENEIKKLHDITYELSDYQDIKPINLTRSNFLLDIYTYQIKLEQFEKKYQTAKKLIDENCDEAIKEFSQMVIMHNKLIENLEFEEKEEIYAKLKEVYKNISIKKLLTMSRQKYSITETKIPTSKKEKTVIQPTERKLGTSFKELHQKIKEGDYSKIIEMNENL